MGKKTVSVTTLVGLHHDRHPAAAMSASVLSGADVATAAADKAPAAASLGKRPRESHSPPLTAAAAQQPTKLGRTHGSGSADETGQRRRQEESRLEIPVAGPSSYMGRTLQGGIQRPTQIASFSYDEQRALHHDDRSQRFYHAPPQHADLNRGFERLVERDDEVNEHLDSLLATLMHGAQVGGDPQADASRRQAHVITWRGMMTKLCTVLYEDRQGFEMNAMMVRKGLCSVRRSCRPCFVGLVPHHGSLILPPQLGDTLYLEEHAGGSKKDDRAKQQQDMRLKRFGYYGYSFESYCCHAKRILHRGDDPWDGDVNTNVQWCSVVKTKLGATRLVIGGEVDAVDPRTSAPVEVKTSMQIRSLRDEERFESKMLRFYMQSFLLGVERVVVGFRDGRGYLVAQQELETLGMPRAVRGKVSATTWEGSRLSSLAHSLAVPSTFFGMTATRVGPHGMSQLCKRIAHHNTHTHCERNAL